jgi:adenylate kinase family enzyme
MRRILLIGSGGAGKSTLARRIAARTGLPLIHLDALYWKPGWVETPAAQWRETVGGLLQRETWVMDGNYGGTLDLRLAACDTVIFLDLPPRICLWRAIKRRLRHRGESRPDMTPGCPERLDVGFLLWIAGYRLRRRKTILGKLTAAAVSGKQAVVLKSDAAVEAFVATLPVPASAPAC